MACSADTDGHLDTSSSPPLTNNRISTNAIITMYNEPIPVYPPHTTCVHTLYHNGCIFTTNFLMMDLHGSKHVEDTL